jgi:hypothetical protein
MVFSRLIKVLVASGMATLLASAIASPASALTADVAKKCRELMVKAHPPLPAGSTKGSSQAQREYFRACVAQDGKMDETSTDARGKQ